MRENFVADWAFGVTGAIENSVRRNFPQEVRRWPLLVSFYAEAYELPEQHLAIVLRDRLSGIPGIPSVPPNIEEVELWQFYLRDKFDLREEDAAVVIPIRDSGGHGAPPDFELFSAQEKMFWPRQIAHVIAAQAAHLRVMGGTGPQQPGNVTF